jgi:thioesterase domain-containing protein
LFAAVKKRFHVSLPLSTLFEAASIRELSSLLEASNGLGSAGPRAADRAPQAAQAAFGLEPLRATLPFSQPSETSYAALVPIQMGSGVPFFCVHGAGGNVLNFRDLARRLGAGQTFYGLQAKGIAGDEPALSIEEMASAYIRAIRAVSPHGPFLLGGYSGGGIVAYEMAQRLRAEGFSVLLVFLDTFHPAVRPRAPSRAERLEFFVAEGGGAYLSRTGKAKLVRTIDQFANNLKTRYFQWRGEPLPIALREAHITRAFDTAVHHYVTKPYDGAVTLYKARVTNACFDHVDRALGWADFIPQLEVVEVPGDHETVMNEPNVQVLINHLKGLIASASRHDLQGAAPTATPAESAEPVPAKRPAGVAAQ